MGNCRCVTRIGYHDAYIIIQHENQEKQRKKLGKNEISVCAHKRATCKCKTMHFYRICLLGYPTQWRVLLRIKFLFVFHISSMLVQIVFRKLFSTWSRTAVERPRETPKTLNYLRWLLGIFISINVEIMLQSFSLILSLDSVLPRDCAL